MTKEQMEECVRKLDAFERCGGEHLSAFLHHLYRLNVAGRREQEQFLEGLYSKEIFSCVFDTEYNDLQPSIQYWLNQDLLDRRSLVELLFKFSVLEDGIRNNEWNMLIQWMIDLRFNNNYIEYFKKRYASLRTEFDAYQRSSGASASNHSLSYLKPYYAELGLQEGATEEEIKRAYHALAMQYHPDLPKNAGRVKECEAMMAKINLAYEKVMG
ncbi:MAG: J domain-containing protein [Paludibacteraceae bacterium]|nr:J domain-containing protein [Paludibacteraceae bacterium]